MHTVRANWSKNRNRTRKAPKPTELRTSRWASRRTCHTSRRPTKTISTSTRKAATNKSQRLVSRKFWRKKTASQVIECPITTSAGTRSTTRRAIRGNSRGTTCLKPRRARSRPRRPVSTCAGAISSSGRTSAARQGSLQVVSAALLQLQLLLLRPPKPPLSPSSRATAALS